MKNNDTSTRKSARSFALDLLCRMESDASYSNIAIDAVIRREDMCENDRALFTVLVYGVTERKITLDYYINSFSSIAPDKIESRVRNILRLGAYQLIYLDRIPEHAAVNECVKLCRGERGAAGFVNALLRKIAASRGELPLPDKDKKPYRYLSIKYSFPIPLCRKFSEIFGFERAESILSSFCADKRTVLRVNMLKITREALAQKLSENGTLTENGLYTDTALFVTGGKAPDFSNMNSLSSDAEFFVQDEASQICVKVLDAEAGQTVIDMCAAPGSKSFGAAIEMNNKGKIFAFDLHQSKISLIDDGARRLGIDIINARAADGTEFLSELENTADRVICDVPCSGFGVCAKKPEIRYKSLEECAPLADIQYKIAENAVKYLKSGGVMVYSTCTLLPEENQENVRRLLASHPELHAENFSVGGISSNDGMLTLTPDAYQTDGFFIAKLRKV